MALSKQKKNNPTPGTQSRLEDYLQQHSEVTSRLLEHQQVVDNAQQEINELELALIPNLLREMGVEECVSSNGTKVISKETFTANVAARNVQAVNRILKRIGAGDAIKVAVGFEFISTEKEQLKKLLAWTKAEKVACEHKTVINPATLKKIAKDALAEGKLKINELADLGIWMTTRAKIKLPKED